MSYIAAWLKTWKKEKTPLRQEQEEENRKREKGRKEKGDLKHMRIEHVSDTIALK